MILTNWVPSLAWDIPLANLSGDSAVVLYWAEKAIPVGGSREIGYDYGLAAITSKEGTLGIGFAGNFEVKQQFTVTAYIQKPAAKQTATIDRARLDHWLGCGAQVSETLAKVLREQKKAAPAAS